MELEECFMIAISLPPLSADLAVSITDEEDTTFCCIQDDDRELKMHGLNIYYLVFGCSSPGYASFIQIISLCDP